MSNLMTTDELVGASLKRNAALTAAMFRVLKRADRVLMKAACPCTRLTSRTGMSPWRTNLSPSSQSCLVYRLLFIFCIILVLFSLLFAIIIIMLKVEIFFFRILFSNCRRLISVISFCFWALLFVCSELYNYHVFNCYIHSMQISIHMHVFSIAH